jgi:hypothetical protein
VRVRQPNVRNPIDSTLTITNAAGQQVGYNDGGSPGADALVTQMFLPGTYHINVRDFARHTVSGGYSFSLDVSSLSAGGAAGAQNTMAAGMAGMPGSGAAGSAGATALAVGTTVTGALAAGDHALEDGSVGDDFSLALTAGQAVTIVTRGGPSVTTPGSNLDVYTVILDAQGQEVTHDDDSAGDLNSRIVFTPPAAGTYTVRVTTFGSGLKQGAYTVQTYAGAMPNQT